MQYLLAHDLGTSGNKATLYAEDGSLVASATYAYPLHTEHEGWAEQDPEDWWRAVCAGTRDLLRDIDPASVAAVSFSGQMMGCLCLDGAGRPLDRAIIWADLRSVEQEEALRSRISPERFYQLTGIRLSSSYSVTKLMWLRDHKPQVYSRAAVMLNAKDYMLYRLTGNIMTDYSDASMTCLLDLERLQWSDELLDAAGLNASLMPQLRRSTDVAGKVTAQAARETGLLEGTPVVCGGGDGACAAVGAGCVEPGAAHCCLGTSSWIAACSEKPVYDEQMLTFSFAHIVPGLYVPIGTMQTGGGAFGWAVDQLCALKKQESLCAQGVYAAAEKMAAESPLGANGLLFLPYLMGERSPRWNPDAKGCLIGLTLRHTQGDVLRAVMEGVGYNADIILQALSRQVEMKDMVIVGGGARTGLWLRILADIWGRRLDVPAQLEEATSMGAAITAGVGVGLYPDFSAAKRFLKHDKTVEPSSERHAAYAKYKPIFDLAYTRLEPIFSELRGEDQ